MKKSYLPLLCSFAACALGAGDLPIGDFETPAFEGWTAEGSAFGAGPAFKEQPGQGPVLGHVGKGYANSWGPGKAADKGALTSDAFVIERPFINFLFAGAPLPEISAKLVVDGQAVRQAHGFAATMPRFAWRTWDVRDLMGKSARIVLTDDSDRAWLLADAFVQSGRDFSNDHPKRTVEVSQRYLLIPHDRGARATWVNLRDAETGELLREWFVRLGDPAAKAPDFWLYDDVDDFRGRRLTLEADWLPEGSAALEGVRASDTLSEADSDYAEALRPQLHYSPKRGRMNDINGFVWMNGEYHLFHQQNPYAVERGGPADWGHAVSKDLIHWRELPVAVYADGMGAVYSGSAVVDEQDTSGLGNGGTPPLVCVYTSAGGVTPASYGKPSVQSLAYSDDGGKTFKKYAGNPVLPVIMGGNRDPKVFWHKDAWVMVLYLRGNTYAVLSSPDLKAWTEQSRIDLPGAVECPDLFELPVQGRPGEKRWIFWGGNGSYLVGQFDGRKFAAESGPHRAFYGAEYAAQTLNRTPPGDDRRIQLCWLTGDLPGTPFAQQASLPRELTLRDTPQGPRVFFAPLKELESLRKDPTLSRGGFTLQPQGPDPLADLAGDLSEIFIEFDAPQKGALELSCFGRPLRYDGTKRTLSTGRRTLPLEPDADGRVRLRAFVDRASIEIFANDGAATLSDVFVPQKGAQPLALRALGEPVHIQRLERRPLAGIW